MRLAFFVSSILLFSLVIGCGGSKGSKDLPIMGERQLDSNGVDTVFYTLPDFAFVDQGGDTITTEDYTGKIYVADFFFTTCPTICPKMKQQMLRIHDHFAENDDVLLLSHTIDPEHDTVEVLRAYAEKLDINRSKWHLVTGEKQTIYDLAYDYMISAQEDPSAPGGFIHSGALILVDRNRHIRGYYDGTRPEETDRLIRDIEKLLSDQPPV